MIYSAILDAGVLLPGYLRNTLLHVAAEGSYRPLWSRRIWAEAVRDAGHASPGVDLDSLQQSAESVQRDFCDAMVSHWEHLESAMTNHPRYRHVLAAAIVGRANGIVTDTLSGFPASSLQPLNIDLHSPDEFLLERLGHAPALVLAALYMQAAKTGKDGRVKLSVDDILDRLEPKVPNFTRQAADRLQVWNAG
ncbi:PIN domain-containing protein [Streptomyces sp. NBC_00161]|uniref:hypothetical protein n=1 Tax=Streptomyces sp. NBC_00161 TaxID=2975671 RepID=UPI00324C8609